MQRALRFLPILAILTIAIILLTVNRPAQVAAVSPGAEYKLWGTYWTVEPGFTSTLEMKNNRVGESLTARVSLYFLNGEELELDSVVLGPRQTVVIDLNEVHKTLPASMAARAGKEGTVEVEFIGANPSAIMGSVSVTNARRGIAWNFFLYPERIGLGIAPVRGLFWFPDHKADGFVAVQNLSAQAMTVTPNFHIALGRYPLAPISLLPGQGYKVELRKALKEAGLKDVSEGGIEFTYDGAPDGLRAHGVLFDNHGFSAEIDFNRFDSWPEETEFFFRTPRFAVGSPDPVLGLRPDSDFEPFVILHNFNRHDLSIKLAAGFPGGESPQEITIPVTLSPGDTQVLNLHRILEDRLPAGVSWGSLELSYKDWHNGLAMMMVSLSEDGKHSIRSVLNWVEASRREGWYWQADSDHNTLVGIFNSDVEPAKLLVSLDYYSNGLRGTYEMEEMELPARGSHLLDVGALIASGKPDRNDNRIPRGVTSGGYRVRKTGARLEENVTTEALLIDRRGSNFLTFYNTGCCHTLAVLSPQGLTGVPGLSGELQVNAVDTCTGEPIVPNLTCSSNYSSLNSSIASTAFCGHVYYNAPGVTSVQSTTTHKRESFPGSGCYFGTDIGYCGVTVNPQITTISPGRGLIGNTTAVTINGIGFGTSPTVQAGSGITVSISSATNTQIQASFAVSSNAPAGNHAVNVTASGQTSNSVNYFVQIPATFRELSVTTSSEVCEPGTAGRYSDVLYQVFDQVGTPIEKLGLTPQEHFTVNGTPAFPGFLPFASPQTTDSLGRFLDTPVGSCFGPPVPAGNPCADIVQSFNVRVPTSSGEVTYTITTITTSRDCALGQRIQISPGGTYTFGTVN